MRDNTGVEVDEDFLNRLLDEVEPEELPPEPSSSRPFTGTSTFDVRDFLRRHGVEHRELPYQGGTKFQLEHCPFDPSHKTPDAVVYLGADGKLGFKCSHASCKGYHWAEFREHFDPKANRSHSSQSHHHASSNGAKSSFEDFENKIPDFAPLIPLSADLPTFPVDALPPVQRRFVEALSVATQVPPDLPALLTMSCFATAIQKRVEVAVGDWREPTNIYVVVGIDPANRKTENFRRATAPLRDFEREQAIQLAGDVRAYQSANRIIEGRIKKLEERAAKADDPAERKQFEDEAKEAGEELANLVPVFAPRLIADDCTPEKVSNLLYEQQGRLAVMSPEGGIFAMMRGRYSSSGEGNLDVYLKGHAGDDLRTDRMSRGTEFVESPALTVGLAVQLDIIREAAADKQFTGRGLTARFLYSVPTSTLGRRLVDAPAVPQSVTDDYAAALKMLCSLPPDNSGERSQPWILTLDHEAAGLLRDFRQWIEPQLAAGGELHDVQGWAGKLPGAVVRLAGIMHAVETHNQFRWQSVPITGSTMLSAIEIGRYLIPHAIQALALLGDSHTLDIASDLLAWIKRNSLTTFTRRDAHQHKKNDSRIAEPEDLDRPLALLVEHGYIRSLPTEKPGPGRKPSATFEVNPLIFGN